MKLRLFQTVIMLGFAFASIYFEWEGGIAIGVMGGMLAYFATHVIVAIHDKWKYGTPVWRWNKFDSQGRRIRD